MYFRVQLINSISVALTYIVLSGSQSWNPIEIVLILVNNVGRILSSRDRDTKTPNSGKRTSKASKMF